MKPVKIEVTRYSAEQYCVRTHRNDRGAVSASFTLHESLSEATTTARALAIGEGLPINKIFMNTYPKRLKIEEAVGILLTSKYCHTVSDQDYSLCWTSPSGNTASIKIKKNQVTGKESVNGPTFFFLLKRTVERDHADNLVLADQAVQA